MTYFWLDFLGVLPIARATGRVLTMYACVTAAIPALIAPSWRTACLGRIIIHRILARMGAVVVARVPLWAVSVIGGGVGRVVPFPMNWKPCVPPPALAMGRVSTERALVILGGWALTAPRSVVQDLSATGLQPARTAMATGCAWKACVCVNRVGKVLRVKYLCVPPTAVMMYFGRDHAHLAVVTVFVLATEHATVSWLGPETIAAS